MKKLTFILALIMCVLTFASCGDPEPRDILDGDGNAVATGYYDGDKLVYEEQVDDKGELTKKTTYDSEGRVEKIENYSIKAKSEVIEYTYGKEAGDYSIRTTRYNVDGDLLSSSEEKFENDLCVCETVTTPTADGKENVEICEFKYNEDGTVLETTSSNGKKIREVFQDGNGIMIYNHEISSNGSSVKIYYDMGTVITKIENFNSEGNLLVTVTNTYDENGVLVRTESHSADGTLKDYSQYVYDGKKLAGIYKYNADGTIHSTIIYDAEGKATVHKGVYVGIEAAPAE